ncbi:uncharacterized protein LOC118425679 [Branchiostoma floridae]|uniref:Uncharacterized protein LOC118425679 n=1 Tax=Branchiostoma floridae TaxID=7739 RepID=A0A9J7N5K3_BRAFL|nr:uncharacterized protein LOC118425679 [Branchiostoma floridae]
MWEKLLFCFCAVMACIAGSAAAPRIAKDQTTNHHRSKRAAQAAIAKFAGEAAMDIGGKVVDALGDRIAEAVVENHQEKVVSGLEEYFSGQFDRADEEFDKVLSRGGDLLSGVGSDLKEAKLTMINGRGSNTGDTFSPPDQEIRMEFEHVDDSDEGTTDGITPISYPMGLGSVLMNGCFGTNYSTGDPCYEAFVPIEACANIIDGATFLGVGFDGRGEYSTDSRKKSLIQRSCNGLQGYKEFHVPDTMTVQGIYNTDVETYSFTSVEEYRQYLETKSSVTTATAMFQQEMNKVQGHLAKSGVFGLFYSVGVGFGVQWGSDSEASALSANSAASADLSEGTTQTFVAMLELNVYRYEIFLDFVTPEDLNLAFLRDFLGLPSTYFAIGADREFQNFLLRWGTHYITSAKFGGQLKIVKVKEATEEDNQSTFAQAAQADFKQLFSTYTSVQTQIKSSSWWHDQDFKTDSQLSSGSSSADSASQESLRDQAARVTTDYSNEFMIVQGGNQQIAAAITEFYTTAFGSELKSWLDSIEEFPKAFEFTMALITDLFDMNFDLLFPHGLLDYGCFGSKDLSVDDKGRRYYVEDSEDPNTSQQHANIRFCNFDTQERFTESVTNRRLALERAIAVYLEEGPFVSADFSIPAGEPGCETSELALLHDSNVGAPRWQDMISGGEFNVIFDLPADIPNFLVSKYAVRVKYVKHRWLTMRDGVHPHTYDGHRNGNSGDITWNKISVGGLVMTYDQDTGLFTVTPEDFEASSRVIPDLPDWINDMPVARAEYKSLLRHLSDTGGLDRGLVPCNLRWSNAHRIDATDGGKCIHFTAASEGDIFVVFASIPRDHESWLSVQISPDGVAMYKSLRLVTSQLERAAKGLGTATLYQSYFVCIKDDVEAGTTTVQYGKTPDSEERIVVWMDHQFDQVLSLHYYSFGSGAHPVKIMRVSQSDQPGDDFIACGAGLEKSGGRCVPRND